jgi:large subunit ribosomal protein L4
MKVDVLNLRGEKVSSLDLDDRVFGIEPNAAVVHQAVVAQQANARQGTHDTKTRGEVAGGGKKPYKQKGTGNARQGSTRAPHYRKGGVVFGPHPRSHALDLPKRMRRLALRSVLSARVAESNLVILDGFSLKEGKTKELLSTMGTLGFSDGALVVLGQRDDNALRAAKNVSEFHVVTPNGMNLLDMLRLPRLVLTADAVAQLTKTLTADLPLAITMPEGPEAKPKAAAKPAAEKAAAAKPAAAKPAAAKPAAPKAAAPVADEAEAPKKTTRSRAKKADSGEEA